MVRSGRGRTAVAVIVAAVLMVAVARPAAAEEDPHQFAKDFGVGVGALFTNLLYMPTKLVYATLGGITGSLAYVLTGLRVDLAKDIWVPSMGGTYVVTPSMLKGEDPIYFSGTTQPKPATHSEEDLPTKRDKDDGY